MKKVEINLLFCEFTFGVKSGIIIIELRKRKQTLTTTTKIMKVEVNIMEKQIEKFSKLCVVFDIMVFDEDPDYVRAVKGKCELKVGKFLLGNDYQIINTLKDVYALFRKQEIKGK